MRKSQTQTCRFQYEFRRSDCKMRFCRTSAMKLQCLMLVLTLPIIAASSEKLCAEDLVKKIGNDMKELAETNKIKVDRDPYVAPKLMDLEEYDMIVVGAGSAGSLLTNRLSEIADWNILLLEAGGEPDIVTDVPMLSAMLQFTNHNWGYVTEKEDNFALGLENQRMHWPRGKGLGGSSLLNYMVYSRGNRIDYDRWAAMGNKGWSYDDVLPYFKKSENCVIQHQDEPYRNKGGELFVEDSAWISKITDTFIEGAKEAGYEHIDYNGKDQIGVSYIQSTTRNGLRCSGERCFLRPVKNRKNLTIRTNSHVTKILVDPKSQVAYGVEFAQKNKTYVAKASKEIILSAGVINSPQILMLSGIGPRTQLERLEINVVKDLPVGRKILDHPIYTGLFFTVNESVTYDFSKLFDPQSYIDLYSKGIGPLHNLGGLEAIAFTKTVASDDPEPNLPDIEYLVMTIFHHSDNGVVLRKTIRMSDKVYDAVFKPLEGKPAFGIFPIIMQPKSFGYMELQSKDPMTYPKLYGKFLADPDGSDVKTMIAGIREAIRITKMPAFQKYDVKVVETKIPGCEAHEYDSDAYWECAVRHLTSTVYHHTTTCKMGPTSDPESVVDDRLRVYGIRNLRVADTSIIPTQLTAHTNVPAYMVGEKAAALIKEDWL